MEKFFYLFSLRSRLKLDFQNLLAALGHWYDKAGSSLQICEVLNAPNERLALDIPCLWAIDLLHSLESPSYLQLATCIFNGLHCVRKLFKNTF